MSTTAIERHVLRTAAVAPALLLTGSMAVLFARLRPDVSGKPFHEDEAVAGLISARPLGDLLHTVMLDRGGAPLHFLLAHFALEFDTTPETLRWVSVVFALATVPLCYDLARRLAGQSAGLVAATLTATSQLLLIYGTFGRMYSLFAFTSALASDLFVRALDKPGRPTALAAATAALLPLAVHPFGAFLFAAEAAVALWLWRGRDLRGTLPVVGVALLALPLVFADLRLSDRYAPEAGQNLDSGMSTGAATLHALGGAAGGSGAALVAFAGLAAAGGLALARRRPAIAVSIGLTLAIPPCLLAIANASGLASDRLAPRHLIFMLPLWIGLVASGAAAIGARFPWQGRTALLAAVVVAAAVAPSAVSEPRTIASGTEGAVAAPAAWLERALEPGDVLYPYSPVFLAALPEARKARAYAREPVSLARAAARTGVVPSVFVSIPLQGPVDQSAFRERGISLHLFPSWLIAESRGPFPDGTAALRATAALLQAISPLVVDAGAQPYAEQLQGTACAALGRLGSSC